MGVAILIIATPIVLYVRADQKKIEIRQGELIEPTLILMHNYLLYCNLNVIGILYLTLTYLPAAVFPGLHLGIPLTTLNASASSAGSTLLNIFDSLILPSELTTNCTITLP